MLRWWRSRRAAWQGRELLEAAQRRLEDEPVWEMLEEGEHRTLFRVSSSAGVFEYWIPNEPLDVLFTKDGLVHREKGVDDGE